MHWKIFFFIYSGLFGLGLVASWNDPWPTYDLFDLPIQIILLIGFFGFAFKRRIVHAKFWSIWLPIYIFWEIAYFFYFSNIEEGQNELEALDFSSLGQGIGLAELGILFAVIFIFFIPCLSIYLYSYKSEDLWNSPSTNIS